MSHATSPLTATVLSRRPLRYRGGADASQDLPPHVRAGSGLAWWGDLLAVVQDDTRVVALVDPDTAAALPLLLPADEGIRIFEPARGNKQRKLDFESAFSLTLHNEHHLIALGSGSTPARETLLRLRCPVGERPHTDLTPELIPLPRLYRLLRETTAFSGSELNLEGAAPLPDGSLMLFQRGNGAPVGDLLPVSATARIPLQALLALLDAPDTAPLPELREIEQHQFPPAPQGATYSFTDAAWTGDRLTYIAVAECSPNSYDDGEVVGSIVGWHDAQGWHCTQLQDSDGSLLLDKPEGLAPTRDGSGDLWMVTDNDDPSRPSELLRVALR
jgi:hypothetical protein